jgi:hypothetical protein
LTAHFDMQHMTGDKGKFKTSKALGKGKEIEFGNKQSLAAEGVGEVELRCVTPDGEQLVTLKEVYYVSCDVGRDSLLVC